MTDNKTQTKPRWQVLYETRDISVNGKEIYLEGIGFIGTVERDSDTYTAYPVVDEEDGAPAPKSFDFEDGNGYMSACVYLIRAYVWETDSNYDI
jgi:hypothetical protein